MFPRYQWPAVLLGAVSAGLLFLPIALFSRGASGFGAAILVMMAGVPGTAGILFALIAGVSRRPRATVPGWCLLFLLAGSAANQIAGLLSAAVIGGGLWWLLGHLDLDGRQGPMTED